MIREPAGDGSRGPGHLAARAAREAIEQGLFALAEIPLDFDRAELRDRLLRAIQCAYTVLDTPIIAAAHLDGLSEAAALVHESSVMLGRAGSVAEVLPLRRAIEHLEVAATTLRQGAAAVTEVQFTRREELSGGARDEPLPKARPFRLSCGLPELHAFARQRLAPHVRVDPATPIATPAPPPAPTPRPETLEQLATFAALTTSSELEERHFGPAEEDAPAPAPAPFAYEPAVEEVEVLRRVARDCLQDIAGFRNLRKPNAMETWLDQEPFEQRLLDNLDAFAALGSSVLPLVSLFHAEAKGPDPERAFAVAFTLGCIDGSDPIGAAVMTLKQSAPEEHAGWTEGFWLGSSPAIDVAMADLAEGARPELVALALDVLHARALTPDGVVRALLDRDETAIATRIARSLATALPRQDAVERLERICATTEDDDLYLAAIESLIRRGHGPAVNLLRHTIDAPETAVRGRRALPLLCLVGRASDLDRLLAAANEAPTVRILRGLGRFGHVESLGTLCNFLEHDEPELVAAAAEALDRITGAGLREVVEEPWEVELPPEAADAGGIPVPMRRVERVVTAPESWSSWVRDNGKRLDPKRKIRAGLPFTPLQIVDELEARATPPLRREEAALELALLTGIASPFSPHDWVARQKRHLAELRVEVEGLLFSPGAWSAISRRPVAEDRAPATPAVAPGRARLPEAPPTPAVALPSYLAASPPATSGGTPAAAPRVKRAPAALSGTSMGFVAPKGPALPFTQGAGAASATPSATTPAPGPATPPPVKRAPAALSGTSMGFVAPKGPALPFAPQASVSPPSPPGAPRAPLPPPGTAPAVKPQASHHVGETRALPALSPELIAQLTKGALPFQQGASPTVARGDAEPAPRVAIPAAPRVSEEPAESRETAPMPPARPKGPDLPFQRAAPAPHDLEARTMAVLPAALSIELAEEAAPQPRVPAPPRITKGNARGRRQTPEPDLPTEELPLDFVQGPALPFQGALPAATPDATRGAADPPAARHDVPRSSGPVTGPLPVMAFAGDVIPFRPAPGVSGGSDDAGGARAALATLRSAPTSGAPTLELPAGLARFAREELPSHGPDAVPFRPVAAPPPAAPGTRPSLTLEAYAALCGELAVFPDRSAAIFQRYGLGDPGDWLTVDTSWQRRLRENPAEYQAWQALYQRAVAHWTVHGRPAGG